MDGMAQLLNVYLKEFTMFFFRRPSLSLTATLRALAATLRALFKQVAPKKQKKYPTMVVSSQQDIDSWNEAVEAGMITRKGNIRKAALHA